MNANRNFIIGKFLVGFGLGTLFGGLIQLWQLPYWQCLVFAILGLTFGIVASLNLPTQENPKC